MKSRIVLFILGFLVWVLITFSFSVGYLVVGIIASALASFLVGHLFTSRPHFFANPARYLWFFYYVPVFIWECLRANIDVAYRVIHPACPIEPGIVKVKTSLKSEAGLTFLANSITLTPGTLTVDLDRKEGALYVHWIKVGTKDTKGATRQIAYRFEKILRRIFE